MRAWVLAHRKINGFRGRHLRIWLARVIVNTCYDEVHQLAGIFKLYRLSRSK
jgi:DNA-directed RNA polymerase specialized sigma24 family protein